MINKKGRIGDFIASVTVLFGVILVMALFVAFSTGLFVTTVKDKLRAGTTSEIKLHNSDLLFEQITINEKKISILEAHRKLKADKTIEIQFENEVSKLTLENGCFALIIANKAESYSLATVAEAYIYKNDAEGTKKMSDLPESLFDEVSKVSISFVGQENEINYFVYAGGCE